MPLIVPFCHTWYSVAWKAYCRRYVLIRPRLGLWRSKVSWFQFVVYLDPRRWRLRFFKFFDESSHVKKRWLRDSADWTQRTQMFCPVFQQLVLSPVNKQFKKASQAKKENFGVACLNQTTLYQSCAAGRVLIWFHVPNFLLNLSSADRQRETSSFSFRLRTARSISSSIFFRISNGVSYSHTYSKP